jgi:ATP-dependent Lon protease
MSLAEANLELPVNFAGIVKLFPLPNLVLFPGVIQPLHIFEPRYRALMRDALESDGLIGVATLKPGDQEGKVPPVFSTMCIGKIVTHAELPDGRFNLLLCGARRARIIREIPSSGPYRMADVQLIDADPLKARDQDTEPLRRRVLHLFRRLVEADARLDHESLEGLINGRLPLGLLVDLMAFSSGASVLEQQSILEASAMQDRCHRVIRLLQQRLAGCRGKAQELWPPVFSFN